MMMTKRSWVLLTIVLLLVVGYVIFFSGWLTPHKIRVVAQLRRNSPNARRPAQPDPATAAGVFPVVFALDRPYTLTSVAVYSTSDLDIEKSNAKPIWHLVADEKKTDKPITNRAFRYGSPIRGMKPADPDNPQPGPLLPGTTYRVVVEVGRLEGSTDFQTRELTFQQ